MRSCKEALQNWPYHRKNRELRRQRTRYVLEMTSPVLGCAEEGDVLASGTERMAWGHGKHRAADGAELLQVSASESETLWFGCGF